MSNVPRPPFQPVAREIIAKLVQAGYLQPAAHNNADAITNAISRMKHDLRGCGGRENAYRNGRRGRSPYPHRQPQAFNVDRLLHLAPNLLS
jgi:hypothetical protein